MGPPFIFRGARPAIWRKGKNNPGSWGLIILSTQTSCTINSREMPQKYHKFAIWYDSPQMGSLMTPVEVKNLEDPPGRWTLGRRGQFQVCHALRSHPHGPPGRYP